MWILKKIAYRVAHKLFELLIVFTKFPEPKLINGKGAVLKLATDIKGMELKNIFLITSEYIQSLGLLDGFLRELDSLGVKYTLFNKIHSKIEVKVVNEAKELYLKSSCDGIVAFGGQSVVYCGKATGTLISNRNTNLRAISGILKIKKELPPLFVVPTSVGSGCESSSIAIVYDHHKRLEIGDTNLIPLIVVVDPLLTKGLPKNITAIRGMEALANSVEAYIGINRTRFTNNYCIASIKLIDKYLISSYNDGDNLEAREGMALASYYGGEAFSRSLVGYVHSIALELEELYHMDHGLASTILLTEVLKSYGSSIYKSLGSLSRGCDICSEDCSDEEATKEFINMIESLKKGLDIPNYIEELRLKDIPEIAHNVFEKANPLYPVPKILKEGDFINILKGLVNNSSKS